MLELSKEEIKFFKKLNTANKIQDYLDSTPFNFEKRKETCHSPISVIKNKKAHCLEGGLLAATALLINGREPIIVSLKVKKGDFDHIITLYKENGYYGCISKTNHNVLRFRDPVYKSVRELVMSYFHEYFFVTNGEKTLLGYTKPINLKKFGTKWITSQECLFDIAEKIYDTPIISVIPKENKKYIRKASLIERKSANIPEYKK